MRIVLDTNILVRANPKSVPSGLARELLLSITSEIEAERELETARRTGADCARVQD